MSGRMGHVVVDLFELGGPIGILLLIFILVGVIVMVAGMIAQLAVVRVYGMLGLGKLSNTASSAERVSWTHAFDAGQARGSRTGGQ